MRAGRAWWPAMASSRAHFVARWPRFAAESWAPLLAIVARSGRPLLQVAGRNLLRHDRRTMAGRRALVALHGGRLLCAVLQTVAPLAGATTGSAHLLGARRCARPSVALGAMLCGCRRTFFVVAAAGGGRRLEKLRRCRDDCFLLGFSSGLSRAAREVFEPIFDIGPVLVDFEILRFLGLELF
ncbi:pentatricopeptide repeat-containing protein mitochondrial-like [Dorcoceras hygrometricum]|uniref:Pentatricopeptide repeat-containing protein mitochondrial-like n=1 Tax=Dorcoceras hygrometricum TaxID=472368 RepID=A0A2Z7CNS1_9LAMI|nr:pentatricopeptide repeat-containing protein mitochondrial-like [Dorcoceras hygrometricum]